MTKQNNIIIILLNKFINYQYKIKKDNYRNIKRVWSFRLKACGDIIRNFKRCLKLSYNSISHQNIKLRFISSLN